MKEPTPTNTTFSINFGELYGPITDLAHRDRMSKGEWVRKVLEWAIEQDVRVVQGETIVKGGAE